MAWTARGWTVGATLVALSLGCRAEGRRWDVTSRFEPACVAPRPPATTPSLQSRATSRVITVSAEQEHDEPVSPSERRADASVLRSTPPLDPSDSASESPEASGPASPLVESLQTLEAAAIEQNPTLRKMRHEAAGAWGRANYAGALPDATLGATFLAPPMNFMPDRQIADIQWMRMVPWLGRLRAEAQRACLEAMALENAYHAERLRVVGDLRAAYYRLYVVHKQIDVTRADQSQLDSLIQTANARVATGDAQPGDVLMATLELSGLQEQIIEYRRQENATRFEINRLVGRDSRMAVEPPEQLAVAWPEWNPDLLRHVAFEWQPEILAARLRTEASRWGIEVARLRRRPDLTFGVGWVVMDAPGGGPGTGRDSIMMSVSTTLPTRSAKYDAMLAEASEDHYAAHASEDDVVARLDEMVHALWEQASAQYASVQLYEQTILPQARQTFEADQQSLINNAVPFDRVIRDYRALLNLELGYHRALGQLAVTLARIRQTVGVDLDAE
ncbi:MAG: TolC family protein [Planctomycetes bacterium]|nr:TolC family protein [Planctomycetota bacterium]